MAMHCVKCGHERVVKHGSVHGIPTHQGQACGDPLTKNTGHEYQQYPLRIKRLAVWLYLSGLSRRRISRLGQCSTPSGLNWRRDEACEHDPKPVPAGPVVSLEVDELGHDLQKSPGHSGSGKRWIVIQEHGLTGHVGIGINRHSRNCPSDYRSGTSKDSVLTPITSIVRSFPQDA